MSPTSLNLRPGASTQAVQAPDLARAFELIRERFGHEALIAETRRIEGPDGDAWVEVVLATGEPNPSDSLRVDDGDRLARVMARLDALAADVEALEGPPDPYPLADDLRDAGCSDAALARLARDFDRVSRRGSRSRTAAQRHLAGWVQAVGPKPMATLSGEHWIVGRAGAGKTTAVLLLAQHLKQAGARPVVITLCPAHPGEVQRFSAAARAIDVAAASAYDEAELEHLRAHFADRDLLLIDTPCCLSSGSVPQPPGASTVHVVTPLGEDPRQFGELHRSVSGPYRLVVTQADLCRTPARLVELCTVARAPVGAVVGRDGGAPRLTIPTSRDLLTWVLPENEPALLQAEA